MDSQRKKGVLEICVLAALQRQPSYGYRIVADLSACIDISESTLYPILRRLESAGCLVTYTREHNGRLRKYYQITDAGRARIAAFLDEWDEIRAVYAFVKQSAQARPETGKEGEP